MFSYYGSKSKIVRYYPHPSYEWIVEPFAGSARYACMYYRRKVWINDKYDVIYRIWKWIQQASWKDIDDLPEPSVGDDVRKIAGVTDDQRLLLSMIAARGVQSPNNLFSSRACGLDPQDNSRRRVSTVKSFKLGIRPLVGRIDHWRITKRDYTEIPNIKATWFIDPPYQVGGDRYVVNGVDYPKLLEWIKARRGETITCENDGNTWLDWYEPLKRLKGSIYSAMEVVRHEMDV